jgi:hypothetical protein
MKKEDFVWVEKAEEETDLLREVWLRPVLNKEHEEVQMIILEKKNNRISNLLVSTRIVLNNHLFSNFDSNFFK